MPLCGWANEFLKKLTLNFHFLNNFTVLTLIKCYCCTLMLSAPLSPTFSKQVIKSLRDGRYKCLSPPPSPIASSIATAVQFHLKSVTKWEKNARTRKNIHNTYEKSIPLFTSSNCIKKQIDYWSQSGLRLVIIARKYSEHSLFSTSLWALIKEITPS